MEEKFVFNNDHIYNYFDDLSFEYSKKYSAFIQNITNEKLKEIHDKFMNEIYLEPLILNRYNVNRIPIIKFSRRQNKNVLYIYFGCKILSGNAEIIQYSLPKTKFPLGLMFVTTPETFSLAFETPETDESKATFFSDLFLNNNGAIIKDMFDKVTILNKEIKKFNFKNSCKLTEHLLLNEKSKTDLEFREFYHLRNPEEFN